MKKANEEMLKNNTDKGVTLLTEDDAKKIKANEDTIQAKQKENEALAKDIKKQENTKDFAQKDLKAKSDELDDTLAGIENNKSLEEKMKDLAKFQNNKNGFINDGDIDDSKNFAKEYQKALNSGKRPEEAQKIATEKMLEQHTPKLNGDDLAGQIFQHQKDKVEKDKARLDGIKQAIEDENTKHDNFTTNVQEHEKNTNNFMKGIEAQTAKKLASTLGYGETIGSVDNAMIAGKAEGVQQAGSDKGVGNALKNEKKDAWKDLEKGAEVNARTATNKVIAAGEFMNKKTPEQEVEYMANVKRNVKEGMIKEQAHGEKLKEKYGAELDGSYKGRTLQGRYNSIEEANIQAQAGKADAIRENLSKNSSMYYENTKYGEESQQQKTAAKIKTQGGIDKAVAVDTAEAAIKAGQQKAAVAAQISQALQQSGTDKGKAEELSKGIVEGSKAGAEEFKKAIATISQKTATLTAGKEASDYKSIQTAGGSDEFIGLQENLAKIQTSKSIGQVKGLLSINPDDRKEFLQKSLDQAKKDSPERYEAVKNDLIKAGLMNKDGSFNTDASSWLKGTSYLQANNMNSTNALVAGGAIISGALGKDSTVKFDTLNSTQTGDKFTKDNTHTEKFGNKKDYQTTDGWVQRAIDDVNKEMPNATQEEKNAAIIKKLTDFKKSETYLDPKKNIAYEFGDVAAMAVGTLGAAGLAVTGGELLERFSKKGVKLNTDELKKQGAIFNEKSGFWEKNGIKVANEEGFAVDKSGNKIEKGLVSRTKDLAGNVKDKLIDKFGPTPTATEQKSPYSSPYNSKGSTNTNPNHNNSFKTKSISTLTDFVDNVKGFAGETAELGMKFGGKALGVAGAALNIYEANKGYHEYLNKGFSQGEAFVGGVADSLMPVPVLRQWEMPAPQTNPMPVNGINGNSVFEVPQQQYHHIPNNPIPQTSGGMMFTDAGASFNQGGVMPSVFNGGGINSVEQSIALQKLSASNSNPFGGDLSKALNSNFQSLGMTFEEQFENLPIKNSFDEFQQNFAK